MVMQSKFPKFRLIIIAIVILTTGLSCKFLSGSSTPTVLVDQTNSPAAPQVAIPDGWKVSKDSTGTCQVATPPDWQLGVDFFIGADKADPGPFETHPGKYPPSGEALWKDNPGLQGHHFQDRRTLMMGELICSVWRIQADVEFSSEQQSEMDQVGKTLEVQ
jgi:hypothetical protein